jgi:hypothetical protein
MIEMTRKSIVFNANAFVLCIKSTEVLTTGTIEQQRV